MSSLGKSPVGNYTPPPDLIPIPTPPPLSPGVAYKSSDLPSPLVAKSDPEARVARQELLQNIKERPLASRKITVDNLIGKEGIQFALGKASGYSKLKDSLIRLTYKVVYRTTKTTDGSGSNHRSAIRLAEKYQKLVIADAPENERLAVLKDLRATLDQMHTKLYGFKSDLAAINDHPVTDMLKFVDETIGSFPTEHLAKGKEIMTNSYRDLVSHNGSMQKRMELLSNAEDHLLAAKGGGVLDVDGTKLLKQAQDELQHIKAQPKLKLELEAFVKSKAPNLKHVHIKTTVPLQSQRDNLAHKRHVHEQARQFLEDDHFVDRISLVHEITNFDKNSLRKVETHEKTGLEHVQSILGIDSLLDEVNAGAQSPRPLQAAKLVHDPDLSDLTARSLTHKRFNQLGYELASAIKSKDKIRIELLSKELGEIISHDLRQSSRDVQLGFVTSRGAAFKNDLLHILASQISPTAMSELSSSYDSANPTVKNILDSAYKAAVSQLTDRYVDDQTIRIDGITYTKKEHIGTGGFGELHVYEGYKEGELHRIAVKSQKMQGEVPDGASDPFDEGCLEVRAHRHAAEGSHPNVNGFIGAMTSPIGGIIIAMELAPNGDIASMIGNLSKAEKQGEISSLAAAVVIITLLKDMALGLQHIQAQRGMTHFDPKPENLFIGEDGRILLGDFGISKTSTDLNLKGSPLDTARNTSPEIARGVEEVSRRTQEIDTGIKQLRKNLETEVPLLPRNQQESASKIAQTMIAELERTRTAITYGINEKTDMWALGTVAYELFKGGWFIDAIAPNERFESDRLLKIAAYEGSKSEIFSTLGRDGPTDPSNSNSPKAVGFGATAVDRMLNRLLEPDPAKRASMDELLGMSLFWEPGVGAPEVRELIKLLSDPRTDPSIIKQASENIGV